MAYQFLTNQSLADGALNMWAFINLLLTNGWTKLSDSDGTTYSPAGTQVTGGNSGANGLNNTRAWVVLQSPAGGSSRQLCIQSTFNDGQYWRLKYSRSAGFTGGSPDAITVPSATDEAVIFGGGSDASPGTVEFLPGSGTYYMQCLMDTSSPYNLLLLTYQKVSGLTNTILSMDGMIAGTYPNQDADPVTIFCNYQNAGSDILTYPYFSSEASGPASWLKYGLAGAGFVKTPALYLSTTGAQVVPGSMGVNAFTGDDELIPVLFARRAALSSPVGYKGVSSLYQWKGSNRAVGDTFNSKTRAVFGDVTIPWDGSTTPAL